jgi:ppGpp synthetase/RelA/SpoT-type nucleotidyltranferase
MKIVQSIQELYNTNLPYFKIVKSKVDEIVKSNKNDRWHYESRIKQVESFAMKVEMGRFDKTEMFEDLFASTIVVKNLSEISLAENFISKQFNIRFKRPQSINFTHKDSSSFPFDDLRLYVSLKDFDTGEFAPNLYEIVFEIQIKTFLQHAWSIATHDLIYKSDKINWAKERIAYQVKAALEHAEVTISGVEELSKISELKKENKEVKKVNQLISMILNHWKPEDLPSDRRRLAQNIIGFIEAIGLSLPDLNEILVYEKQQGRGTLTRNLSPFLIVVQSVFNVKPDKITDYLQNENNKNKQKILITSEMSVPELGEVLESKIVRI